MYIFCTYAHTHFLSLSFFLFQSHTNIFSLYLCSLHYPFFLTLSLLVASISHHSLNSHVFYSPLHTHPTTTLPHYTHTPLPHYLTTSLPHYPTTTLPHYPTTETPHYPTTQTLHYPTTPQPHYPTTPLPHYNPTPQPIPSTSRSPLYLTPFNLFYPLTH